MKIVTTINDMRSKDMIDLHRTTLGVPAHIADERIVEAYGVDDRTSDGEAMTSDMYVKRLLGITGARARFIDESRLPWRVLRRNIVTSYAVLRAHIQTVSGADTRRAQRFSPGIKRELEQLTAYHAHILESLGDDAIGSATFYMADLDSLLFFKGWAPGWIDGVLTRGGAFIYERQLEGFADPLSFIEHLAKASRQLSLNIDLRGFAVPKSVHALAVKLMLEDLLVMAHDIGSDGSPVAMNVSYNRMRDTIDVETPGDRRLFDEVRSNPRRVSELRANHDGWWLEGDRLAIPARPFNYFSQWEMVEREIWENASALTPLMRKIVAGGELCGDDATVWQESLQWFGEVASPVGMLAQLQDRADKQGTREGYVVAHLVAKLRNTLQPFYSLNDVEERIHSGARIDPDIRKKMLGRALEQGFPDGMQTLMRINGVLGPSAIRNLDIQIDLEEDFTATRSKQYAINRFFNALFMLAALRAGIQEGVTLEVGYRKGVIHLRNEDGRLFGMQGGRPSGIFAEAAQVQPKLITEVLDTARYISSDGGGMHISNSTRSAHIVVDPNEEGIRIPYGRRSTLLPIPAIVRFNTTEMPFMQGMLTFYPTLQGMSVGGGR